MKHLPMIFLFIAILLYAWLVHVESLEVMPERPEILYYNKKYIRDFKLAISRRSRKSPYYIDLQGEILTGAGNNVTFTVILYEQISGRYIMTPIHFEYKLCDFMYNEPYLGQMYAKQLPKNWTCPFPAGKYHYKDLVVHLEKFPYNLPFVWFSYKVETRVDVNVKLLTTNETLLTMQIQCAVIQKSSG